MICHPDRASADLHDSMEAKSKALNAAWGKSDFATIRQIAVELGVKDVPPLSSAPPPPPKQRQTPPSHWKKPTKEEWLNAVRAGDDAKIKQFIVAGANLNTVQDDGWTALMLAAVFGHSEIAEMLLAAGANPNARDKDGWTALMMAGNEGYSEVVKVLLVAGANPFTVNYAGKTALKLADRNGYPEVVRILEEAKAK